jgi:hypothetical protein
MPANRIFEENFSIEHDGHPLFIEKALSSGLTGEVYRARLTLPEESQPLAVAVKVMKALDFPLARQLFYKEGETLSFLMHLEEETNDALLEVPLKIAPRYYGLSEYHPAADTPSIPYLVMEFIEGRQVQELLKENGEFSEKDALLMGWHLYRIFDILHTRLLKTFIDLKFENLWWTVRNDKWGGQLRLTDFGTLEELKATDGRQRGVHRDLLLGGVYLLAMLTHKFLDYSLGELHEPAEPVIKHHAEKMTWGTRRLLFKLLHRNPDARPKSATEALNDLRLLASFWSQTEEQLHKRAMRELTTAETEMDKARGARAALSQAGLDAAARALSALDILRLRAPQLYKESDAERARAAMAFGDYFDRGFALLQGRSFQLARQTFEEGMKWVEDPALLRRWAYVAQIGEDIPPADFEKRLPDLKSLLEFINDPAPNPSRWSSARRDFAALSEKQGEDKPSLRSKGLSALLTECDLYEKYEQAQVKYLEEDFEAAAGLYGEVEILLKSLPAEARRLIENETGHVSVSQRAAEARKARQGAEKAYRDAQEALKGGDFKTTLEHAQQAYNLYRPLADKEFHIKKLTGLIQSAFLQAQAQPSQAEGCFGVARDLAEIGWYEYLDAPDAGRILRAVLELSALEQALQAFDAARYMTLLRKFHQNWGAQDAPTESLAVSAARRATSAGQGLFLSELANGLGELIPGSVLPQEWSPTAREILSRNADTLNKQVDGLLQDAYQAILPILPDPQKPQTLAETFRVVAETAADIPAFDLLALGDKRSRLESARESLARAARLLGESVNYRRDEIHNLYRSVESALHSVESADEAQAQAVRQQRAERLLALSAERRELDEQLEWALRAPQGTPQPARESLYSSLRQKISGFLYRCYLAEGLEREDLRQALIKQAYANSTPVDSISLQALRQWAITALNALGGDGWKQVMELASAQAQTLQTWHHQALQAFMDGKLGTLAAELDRTQKDYGAATEWQSLKAGLAQAQAWLAWCQARQAKFDAVQLDGNILRDLLAFPSIGLPITYWQQSAAPAYLDALRARLESDLREQFRDPFQSPQFLETLCTLLNVSWTKSLASRAPGVTESARAWNPKAWLQTAYALTVRKDQRGLLAFVSQTAPPEHIEEALRSFTHADWLYLRQADEKRLRDEARRKRALIVLGIGAVACLLACFLLFIFYQVNQEWVNQQINGTYTPTPSVTPSITPTPTQTLIPTETPTETPTATPIPASAFLLANPQQLYPPVPLIGDAYWVLDESRAVLQPPQGAQNAPWRNGESADPKATDRKFIYAAKGVVTAGWSMDEPFDVDGTYAIYVLDTSQQSKGPQSFQVLLDGAPTTAYRGSSSSVIFLGSAEAKNSDRWLPLGVYSIARGQSLGVTVTTGELTADIPFAVDRLLIVRINETTRQMLDALPAGRTLVSLLDNAQATFYEANIKVKDQGATFTDTLAWNGDLLSRGLGETGYVAPIQVDWAALNRLPPGEYEVYVWIPAQHATVAGEYILLTDDQPFKRDNPATVNQKDHSGVWLSLGTWKLDKEALVGLRLLVEKNTPGEIGIDAVAIVSVGQ